MSGGLLKLPLFTLVAGIILRTAGHITVRLLLRDTTDWANMGTAVFYVQLFLSVALLVSIGLLLRKRYSRSIIIKSTTLLVFYSIVILALDRIIQHFGSYNMIIYYLYVPVEMFSVITSVLVRTIGSERISWLYVIPSLFAPYLFLLFSKKSVPEDLREHDAEFPNSN